MMLHRRRHSPVEGCSDRARRAAAMKGAGRGISNGGGGVATDLLVCFPSRAHLALMPPKAIVCSPSRPSSAASEPVKRRRSASRAGGGQLQPSALSKSGTVARNNQSRRAAAADAPVDDEPSSPKVTCVGQIKSARPAKPRDGPCGGGKRKKATWLQALGIKKVDGAVPFLDALHGAFRFNVRGCFGGFPGAAVDYTSDEDDDEEEDEPRAEKETEHGAELARWFMVLEEGKKVSGSKKQGSQGPQQKKQDEGDDAEEEEAAPPANALMLMRCRSAPAKGLARRLGVGEAAAECEDAKSGEKSPEAAEEKEQESLVVMTYSPDFFKVSLDIAKETWIVGGDDAVLRCRSWKR